MNEPLITECPSCHSRFRVTEGQLNLAQGQVRCGACLLVFDARAEAHRLARKQHNDAGTQALIPVGPRFETPAQPSKEEIEEPQPEKVQPPEEPLSRPTSHVDENDAIAAPETKSAEPGGKQQTDTDTDSVGTAGDSPENIPHLYAEPILLEVSREQNDPYTTTGWALASLVALLTLAAQYLWFDRATLAHNPDLHPVYALACDNLPCELGRDAYRAITNENMVVRPHPAFADALSVDIQLRNDAAFAQPYPALSLTFTDLKGRLVASRTFQPGEYLPADRTGSLMQPMVPVQLQLEITDPGVRAVSYQLELLPAGRG